MFDEKDIIQFTEIASSLKYFLMPYAFVFLLISVVQAAYTEFVEKEKLDFDYEGRDIVFAALRKQILPLIVFFFFDTLCLLPVWMASELENRLKDIDVIEGLYESKLSDWEKRLKESGYLTSENITAWDDASVQSKVAVIGIVKNNAEAQQKMSPTLKSNVNIALGIQNDDSFLSWFTGLDVADFIHHFFIILLNFIRQGVEYLFIMAFKFLLYLDILVGQFAVLFAIIPSFRGNIIRWFMENLSLCMWAIIFVLIGWILNFVTFRTTMNATTSVADWVMPLLSIVTYTAIGAYAGKMVGREATGTSMLNSAYKTVTNTALPAAGSLVGSMLGTIGGIATTSKASAALSGAIGKAFSHPNLSPVTSKVSGAYRGAQSAVDFFKPQPKVSAMERVADNMESLKKGLVGNASDNKK